MTVPMPRYRAVSITISSESSSPRSASSAMQLRRKLLAGGQPLRERSGPAGVEKFLRAFDDGRGAGVGFEMAAPAAAAHAGVVARVDDDVARLAAVAVGALDHHVADDDAAADAGAKRQQDHALKIAARADPVFAIGGGVGVVLEGDRHSAMVAHAVADGEIVPAGQVDDRGQHARGNVHAAGRAEPNPGDGPRFEAGVADGLMHGGAHASGGVFRAGLDLRGNAQPREHSSQVVDHADLDVRSSQVDSHEKRLLSFLGRNERAGFWHDRRNGVGAMFSRSISW